jgi:DNA-binding NarL/FixJ family response regulator
MAPNKRLLLTRRERQIAGLVARGLRNSEIAQRLGNTVGTVKFQVHCVLLKLGASRRQDLPRVLSQERRKLSHGYPAARRRPLRVLPIRVS